MGSCDSKGTRLRASHRVGGAAKCLSSFCCRCSNLVSLLRKHDRRSSSGSKRTRNRALQLVALGLRRLAEMRSGKIQNLGGCLAEAYNDSPCLRPLKAEPNTFTRKFSIILFHLTPLFTHLPFTKQCSLYFHKWIACIYMVPIVKAAGPT